MKKFLLIMAALLMLGAGSFAGWPYHKMYDSSKLGHRVPKPHVTYVRVKEMTLRLADANFEHYIKIAPVLAVKSGTEEKFKQEMPVVRDRIVTVVTALSSAQLMSPQGNQNLKKTLMDLLNRQFSDDVVGVYFNRYLVE